MARLSLTTVAFIAFLGSCHIVKLQGYPVLAPKGENDDTQKQGDTVEDVEEVEEEDEKYIEEENEKKYNDQQENKGEEEQNIEYHEGDEGDQDEELEEETNSDQAKKEDDK